MQIKSTHLKPLTNQNFQDQSASKHIHSAEESHTAPTSDSFAFSHSPEGAVVGGGLFLGGVVALGAYIASDTSYGGAIKSVGSKLATAALIGGVTASVCMAVMAAEG